MQGKTHADRLGVVHPDVTHTNPGVPGKRNKSERGQKLSERQSKDGEGERANIDFMSRNLVVEAPQDDMRGLLLGAASLGFVFVIGLVALLVSRRRRAQEELELLTSWDAFRAPASKAETDEKNVPALEENIMDGTEEVQATLEDLD